MVNVLLVLADIANGIFAVSAAAYLYEMEIAWWHFLIGIALAMLPDLDAVPDLLRYGKLGAPEAPPRDHREGLHYPLPFLLIGLITALLIPYWGLAFLFAVTLHFINDLYGTGWGVKSFWPFSRRNYKLLGRRVNKLKFVIERENLWEQLPESERRLRLFFSWSPEELPHYMQQGGSGDWRRDHYLTFNWVSGTEYALFTFALILVVLQLL